MTRHENIPSPENQGLLKAQEILSAGSGFLEHFGVTVDAGENPEEFVDAVKQLDPRFKGDRTLVRWELEADDKEWPEDDTRIIMDATESMGLLKEKTELSGQFGMIAILGGARQANLDRTRYAIDQAYGPQYNPYGRSGGYKSIGGDIGGRHYSGVIAFAGSSRKLNDAEKENVANYAPNAETEADLLAACLEYSHTYQYQQAVEAGKVRYPQITRYEPHFSESERATVSDVFEPVILSAKSMFADDDELNKLLSGGNSSRAEFLEAMKQLSPSIKVPEEYRIAAVTTQIYQPFTQLELSALAQKHGMNPEQVVVIGNPSDPEIVAKRTTATYLSEVIRTLKAAAKAQ